MTQPNPNIIYPSLLRDPATVAAAAVGEPSGVPTREGLRQSNDTARGVPGVSGRSMSLSRARCGATESVPRRAWARSEERTPWCFPLPPTPPVLAALGEEMTRPAGRVPAAASTIRLDAGAASFCGSAPETGGVEGERAISRLGDGTGLMARALLIIGGTGLRRLALLMALGSLLRREAAARLSSDAARTPSSDSPSSATAVSASASAAAPTASAASSLMAPVARRKRFTSVVVCRWKASTWASVGGSMTGVVVR